MEERGKAAEVVALLSALQSVLRLFPHLDGLVRIQGFIVATGFSGHGFAMGPGAGVVVSELVLDGQASVDIHPMRLGRFAEGQPNLDPEAV